MMRFNSTKQYRDITNSIREGLQKYGLWGLRADDKYYSDDLWSNVCAYMLACKYGIAVFEDIDERSFNPNVAIEYGFMLAQRKRVLLLKEKRMPKIPTDITGKLWKPFSIFDIDKTIKKQIDSWIIDINLSPKPDGSPYIPTIEIASSLKQGLLYKIEYLKEKGILDEFSEEYKVFYQKAFSININNNPSRAIITLQDQFSKLERLLNTIERPKNKDINFVIGQQVEITDGPFKGMVGKIINIKDKSRIILTIQGLMESVSLEIDKYYLKILK